VSLKPWQVCPSCDQKKSFYAHVCRRCNHTPGLKHGHNPRAGKSLTYVSWDKMWQRCTNPNDAHYYNYGARGIRVCARWKKFENFLADMGERRLGFSIDRYPDKNGNYEPTNCRWATWTQQMNNSRRNRKVA
jgi:ribosomal protein L40E